MPRKTEFGGNWWARRWIEALESLGWANRLQRGRSYARNGRVKSVQVAAGVVNARVQGSRPTPYRIAIKIRMLAPEAWARVLEELASQAIFVAKLLAGEMPPDVDQAFEAVGVSLFPDSDVDLDTSCSCPDWANPCKHIAAVHYVLGEEFDRDPFLLFELRGKSKEDILRELRARRTEVEGPAASALEDRPESAGSSLEANLERFWSLGEDISSLLAPPGRPQRPMAVLRLLGPPPFSRGAEDVAATLAAAYERIAKRAVEVAYGGGEGDAEGATPPPEGKL